MAQTQCVGKSGQLAVMSELALRGYNVAMPEIDRGDDIFVVNDVSGALYRLQVKTANATAKKQCYRGKFTLRPDQLHTATTPELHYVFAVRMGGFWKFLIISREVLNHLRQTARIGTEFTHKTGRKFLTLDMDFYQDGKVSCSGQDLSVYLDNWSTWKPLEE